MSYREVLYHEGVQLQHIEQHNSNILNVLLRILCSYNFKVALTKTFFDIKSYFCKTCYFCKKDPVPKEQKSDAMYSIPCNDCNQEYIGQTKRQFGTRLNEHHSSLSEHKCQTNNTIAWDNSYLSPPIDGTIKDVAWKLGT